eukprot:94554-Prorocentrum_lima.AAC.1
MRLDPVGEDTSHSLCTTHGVILAPQGQRPNDLPGEDRGTTGNALDASPCHADLLPDPLSDL